MVILENGFKGYIRSYDRYTKCNKECLLTILERPFKPTKKDYRKYAYVITTKGLTLAAVDSKTMLAYRLKKNSLEMTWKPIKRFIFNSWV